MFCTNCGNPVSDNAKFCPSCGAVLNQDSQPISAQQPQPAPQPQAEAPAPQPAPAPQETAAPAPEQSQPTYAAPAPAAAPEPAPNYQAAAYQPAQPSSQPAMSSTYPPAASALYGAQPAYAGTTTYAPPAPKKKTGLIVGICVGGVVVIAAVVLLILWLTGVFGGSNGSPKAVAESYVSAIMQPEGVDGQAILDLLPDQLVNEAIAEGSFSSEREMAESLEYAAGTVAESLQYLEDYGISYEYTVGQGTPVSESELSSVQDAYQEYNINVGAAQTVEVVFTLSYQGETMEETIEVPVVQIGGSWYLDSYSLS